MRSRVLKPGFFTNEDVIAQSMAGRLLFQGLWLLADREGRLEDRPRRIKMYLFPCDDVDVEELLAGLHQCGLIIRYEVENEKYIQIPKFSEHQRPHPREASSTIPVMTEALPRRVKVKPRSGPAAPRREPRETVYRKPKILKIPDQETGSAVSIQENNADQEGSGVGGPGEGGAARPQSDSQAVVEAWNALGPPFAPVQKLSDERRKKLKARLDNFGLPKMLEIIGKIQRSAFCRGQGSRYWLADFDWLLKGESSGLRVLEGRYDDRGPPRRETPLEINRRLMEEALAEEKQKANG